MHGGSHVPALPCLIRTALMPQEFCSVKQKSFHSKQNRSCQPQTNVLALYFFARVMINSPLRAPRTVVTLTAQGFPGGSDVAHQYARFSVQNRQRSNLKLTLCWVVHPKMLLVFFSDTFGSQFIDVKVQPSEQRHSQFREIKQQEKLSGKVQMDNQVFLCH